MPPVLTRFARSLVSVCLAVAAGTVAAAQPAPVPPRDATAFINVNVLPMDGGDALHGQVVLVEDGLVSAIGGSLEVPDGARVVDGGGSAWLLPGLADMHNHADRRQDLEIQLALGITTTLHMGEAPNGFIGRTRAAVADGERAGPRAFAALAVDGSPRYGHLVVTDADDARAAVRVASSNGYEFIKAYSNLSAGAFAALAQEARAHGIGIVGHGVADVGLPGQLEAGQTLVAHAEEFFYAFFPQPAGGDPNAAPGDDQIDAAIALLRRHGAAVVADLVTYETIARQWGRPEVVQAFLRTPGSRYLHPEFRVSWPLQGYARREGSLESRAGFLRRFVKEMDGAGVPLLSGTDAPGIPGLVPGFALHRNLALLVEAGLDPEAALATATRAPGEFIRRHRPGLPAFGIVAEGARADLLLVAADPLADLATLASPLGVMAGGRWYPRADLEARKDAVLAAYRDAAASARDAAPAQAAHGVGFAPLRLEDPVGGGPMAGMVWYPSSETPDGPVELGLHQVEAGRELPPLPGRRPLVVISHGQGGDQFGHHTLATHLAANGFIVATLEHPRDNPRDRSGVGTAEVLFGRPLQVQALVTHLLGSERWGALVDPGRIGAAGFSDGGYTALLLAGAVPRFDRYAGYCRRNPGDRDTCEVIEGLGGDASDDFAGFLRYAGTLDQRRREMDDTADPRIRAVFAMAPTSVVFDAAGAESITTPVFLYYGENDTRLPPGENALHLRELLQVPVEVRQVPVADHWVFLPPCSEALAREVPMICSDPPGVDRAAVHARVNADAVEFFTRTLAADPGPVR